jgi:hypothetical protein
MASCLFDKWGDQIHTVTARDRSEEGTVCEIQAGARVTRDRLLNRLEASVRSEPS